MAQPLKITFCMVANEAMPSSRYRAMLPGKEIQRRGHEVKFGPPDPKDDVAIFSKHFDPKDVERIRKFPGRKIFDCCDDHFHNQNRDHYMKMIEAADLVTCTTEKMKEVIELETGVEPKVIPDPYEFPEGPAKLKFHFPLRLMWFGHSVNHDTIQHVLPKLQEYDIKIVSNKPPSWYRRRPLCRFEPWSPTAMMNNFKRADIVFLPTLPEQRHKSVKSHNRPLEAIRYGRFVVMGELPSYQQFRDLMWVGDIQEGLRWAEQHPDECAERVGRAQEFIRSRYSPKVIGEMWLRACDPSRES